MATSQDGVRRFRGRFDRLDDEPDRAAVEPVGARLTLDEKISLVSVTMTMGDVVAMAGVGGVAA